VDTDVALGLLPFGRVAEVPRSEWDRRLVRDCMIPLSEVPQLAPDEPLVDALIELSDGIGRGLVLGAENRLVGFLSVSDLMRALELGGLRRRR
jgi:CBS domain-containing protein